MTSQMERVYSSRFDTLGLPPVIEKKLTKPEKEDRTLTAFMNYEGRVHEIKCISRRWTNTFRLVSDELGEFLFAKDGKDLVYASNEINSKILLKFRRIILVWIDNFSYH